MAAGKSTVAQGLAETLPRSVHLRGDVFRRMIVNGRADPIPDMPPAAATQLALRYRIASMVARQYVEAGFTVVYQDVILEDDLRLALSLLEGLALSVVVLCPSPEAIVRRDEERGKTGYGGAWSVADLNMSLRRTPRLGLWLDTSALTPQQTVEVILRRLGEARVPVRGGPA